MELLAVALTLARVERPLGDDDITGLWRQDFQRLFDHDWPVAARGCFARSKHLRDRFCVARRIMFLVFFRKAPWMLAGITRPATRSRWLSLALLYGWGCVWTAFVR